MKNNNLGIEIIKLTLKITVGFLCNLHPHEYVGLRIFVYVCACVCLCVVVFVFVYV